jgi:hypothetical protein
VHTPAFTHDEARACEPRQFLIQKKKHLAKIYIRKMQNVPPGMPGDEAIYTHSTQF